MQRPCGEKNMVSLRKRKKMLTGVQQAGTKFKG